MRSSGIATVHSSFTIVQRRANEQPAGRCPGEGARPGMPTRLRRPSRWGTAATSRRGYGWAAAGDRASAGASPTIRPADITATRAGSDPATARSWLAVSAPARGAVRWRGAAGGCGGSRGKRGGGGGGGAPAHLPGRGGPPLLAAAADAVHVERLGQLGADAQGGVECRGRILRHVRDDAAAQA